MYSKFCLGICFVISVFIPFQTADAQKGLTKDRETLWHILSERWNTDIAPDGTDGGPVIVYHYIIVQSIVGWENDILSLHLYEVISWNDPRLRWDPDSEYGKGIRELTVPSRTIWQPDIVLFNSVEEYRGFISGDLHVKLDYQGNVTFVLPRITKSMCYLDGSLVLANKTTTCTLKYGSWMRSDTDLDLQLGEQPVIADNSNPYWNMTEITTKRNTSKYKGSQKTFIDMEYALKLRRK